MTSWSKVVPQYDSFSRSDIGSRTENQDACGYWQNDEWMVAVVADGAGGHTGGGLAAAIAVNDFLKAFREAPTVNAEQLYQYVLKTNNAILKRQIEEPEFSDMHTTIVVVVIHKPTQQAMRLHSGDSRLYQFSTNGYECLTEDHSEIELRRLKNLPTVNASRNSLYSMLGEPTELLRIDVEEIQQPTNQAMHHLLLCTDGLWETWLSNTQDVQLMHPLSAPQLEHFFAQMQKIQSNKSDNFTLFAIFPSLSGQ